MPNYVIFYSKIIDDKELGIIADFPFYGGESETMESAEEKAKELVNNKQSQVTIIPKIFKKGKMTFTDVMNEAKIRFQKMANEMYDCEAAMQRRRKH